MRVPSHTCSSKEPRSVCKTIACYLQGWGVEVFCHLVHSIGQSAWAQGGVVQAVVTPLEAQLAGVAELHTQGGGMAACNVKPHLPLCSAGIAPAAIFTLLCGVHNSN